MGYKNAYGLKNSPKLLTDMNEEDFKEINELLNRLSDEECFECWSAVGLYNIDNAILMEKFCETRLKKALFELQKSGKFLGE